MPGGLFRLKRFLGVRTDVPPTALRADYRTGETELAPSPNVWADPSGTELGYVLNQRFFALPGNALGEIFTSEVFPEQMAVIPFEDEAGAHHQVVWVERPNAATFGADTRSWLFWFSGYDFTNAVSPAPPTAEEFLLRSPTAQNRPGWVVWRGRLYLFFGSDVPGVVLSRNASGGLTPSNLGVTWATGDQPRARVAWLYRNHLMLGGFDSPEASTIRNCALNDPGTLVASNLSFWLGRGDGDRVVAGMEFPVYGGGTYIEPYCFVWKRHSTWMLQGPPPNPGDTTVAINVVRVRDTEGCIAPETVAATEHGVLWCSGTNVWLAEHGKQPRKLGDALRGVLAYAPQNHRSGWHAAYHNGVYRLSIPSTRVRGDFATGKYVTDTEQWWLDLRRYASDGVFSWWGPMDLPSSAMTTEWLPEGTTRLVGLVGSCTPGLPTTSFRAHVWHEVSAHDAFIPPGVFLRPELPIPDWEVYTKEFDGGDENLQKLPEAVELHAKRGLPAGLDMTVRVRGNEGTSYIDLVGATGSGGEDILDSTVVLDTSTLGGKFNAVSYHPTSRFLANTLQVRVALAGSFTGIPEPKLRSIGVRLRVHGRRS